MSNTVLILGMGELGGLMAELLARSPRFAGRIVGADINADLGLRKINSARQGAIAWGSDVALDFAACDMSDVDRIAELLHRVKPDLVFNATTVSSWWLRDLLPADIKGRLHAIGAGSGLWSAGHAAYAYNMMRAVRRAGITPWVVNSAYPDAVNPALARAGLAPTTGIGNGALLEAPFRQLVASKLDVAPSRVRVTLVAHHFHGYNTLVHGDTRGLDFHLRIQRDGEDVTARFDRMALVKAVPDAARIPGAAGATWIVAAQAMQVVLALVTRGTEVVHAPGPLGLVGGYPVRMAPQVALALPDDIDRERAIAINEAAQRAEGIDRIDADGTLVLGDVARATLKDVFGFECDRYRLDDCLEIARELGIRLRELGDRLGIRLKVHA
ncbi:MAG: hypothetical protein JNK67_31480 [Alphaproteobacteria bacterium]|nr:hypothetical protein [Alphaproteobacteria bacterium]